MAMVSVMTLRCVQMCVFMMMMLSMAVASPVFQNLVPADIQSEFPGSQSQSQSQEPLVNFQVTEPVVTPTGSHDEYGCVVSQVLMSHVFTNSYGVPYTGMNPFPRTRYLLHRSSRISFDDRPLLMSMMMMIVPGRYDPPPCSFNRVTINITVTTQGRQFDRLGIMYLGGVEIFRTSTAEPTPSGIKWTYVKEVGQYLALWKNPQDIVFALPNIVNDVYTGPLNTTLTATFFTVPDPPATADRILPIASNMSGPWGTAFQLLESGPASVELDFPRNVARAVVSLSACGQQAEEFWYTNVFNQDTETFPDTVGQLSGYSPFREVQLLIDGRLAGVIWPFAVVFTGGIVPGFWRPIVGIDAFDLRQHEIDVTPWLPLLCDGASHTFEIRVVGLDDDRTLSKTVGSFWLVTGTVFLFLDPAGSQTTGNMDLSVKVPPPRISMSSSTTLSDEGVNTTLTYSTTVSRDLSISSTITTSNGSQPVSWTQTLSYNNLNILSNYGVTQSTSQNTTGHDLSLPVAYSSSYQYALSVNSTFLTTPDHTVTINGAITQGLDLSLFGPSVFPSGIQDSDSSSFISQQASHDSPSGLQAQAQAQVQAEAQAQSQAHLPIPSSSLASFQGSKISTTLSATAEYHSSSKKSNDSYSFGSTTQDFDYYGLRNPSTAAIDTVSNNINNNNILPPTLLYHRHVEAVNTTVVDDEQDNPGPSAPPSPKMMSIMGKWGGRKYT